MAQRKPVGITIREFCEILAVGMGGCNESENEKEGKHGSIHAMSKKRVNFIQS